MTGVMGVRLWCPLTNTVSPVTTQQRPHNSDPAGFNDQDSYGPATTQQQSHNRDPGGFKTTTMSKTNQKFSKTTLVRSK